MHTDLVDRLTALLQASKAAAEDAFIAYEGLHVQPTSVRVWMGKAPFVLRSSITKPYDAHTPRIILSGTMPTSAHRVLALERAHSTLQEGIFAGFLPLITTLRAEVPALQGDEGQCCVGWARQAQGSGATSSCTILANHCAILPSPGKASTLDALVRFVHIARACAPATQAFVLGTSTTIITAANAQDAATLMNATQPYSTTQAHAFQPHTPAV